MNIREKEVVYAFCCPCQRFSTIRLAEMVAFAPDPDIKKFLMRVREKVAGIGSQEEWADYYWGVRVELEMPMKDSLFRNQQEVA